MALVDFSTMNYENILESMLSNVDSSLDKREGSVIYNALAPCAQFLAQVYMHLQYIVSEMDPSTASMAGLEALGAQIGLYSEEATNAVVKAEFKFVDAASVIDLTGYSFTCDSNQLEYTCAAQITDDDHIYYRMICSSTGTEGNLSTGNLIANDDIVGLNSSQIVAVLTYAENDEDAESFRIRYYNELVARPFAGNLSYYNQVINELDGVGGCQIHPLWDGTAGHIGISCIDTDQKAIDSDLISEIQKEVDPSTTDAEYVTGSGLAPIDHHVTISTPTEVAIDCTMTLSYKSSEYDADKVRDAVTEIIENYYASLRSSWAASDEYGAYSLKSYDLNIESKILNNVEGVTNVNAFYQSTTDGRISTTDKFIELNEDLTSSANVEIPVIGTITIG